jgi:hypothetical protein
MQQGSGGSGRENGSGSSFRDGEFKPTAFAIRRFHPDPAAVQFHDFLAMCQPDARSRVFMLFVHSPEYGENLLLVVFTDANAVVLNAENPVFVIVFN